MPTRLPARLGDLGMPTKVSSISAMKLIMPRQFGPIIDHAGFAGDARNLALLGQALPRRPRQSPPRR
jgi:hypothetical protein